MSAIRTTPHDPVDDVLDAHGGDARLAIAALLGRLETAKQACSAGYSRRAILRPALRPFAWQGEEVDVDGL